MKPEELHLKSGARNTIEGDGWKFEAVKDFVVFDGFSCADHDLDEFLREDAQDHQTRLLSVTYAYSFVENGADVPVAFASIANSSMSLLDKHRLKHLLKDVPYREFPCVKIGRLGVRDFVQGKGVGTSLLNIIKDLFTTNNRTGCRFLTVDAYRNQRTLNFYEKNDFLFYSSMDRKSETRIMYYDLARFRAYP